MCTDALDPGAFTPVLAYCSDHSNRTRTLAPLHPHVAWTKPVANAWTNLGLLVDAQSNAYFGEIETPNIGNVLSFDALGNERWSASTSAGVGVLLSSTLLVETNQSPWSATITESTGAVTPATWPHTVGRVAVSADGSAFVELLGHGALSQIFGGVSRVDSAGATQWTERGDCAVDYGDFLTPHDFVRRDDNLILVCNTSDHAVQVLEVDGTDARVSDKRIDGGLVGGVALAPNGTVAFFVSPDQIYDPPSASLVTIDRAGNVEMGPSLTRPSIAAVAADGTLIATSSDSVVAIAANAVRWTQLTAGNLLFVDDATTIVDVNSTTAMALDVTTGNRLWTLSIPNDPMAIASGGPGRVYVLTMSSLTLIED